MLYENSQKINVVSHCRSRSGVRVVHDNINRRTTDVLNAKGDYGLMDPKKLKLVKEKALEKNEKELEQKMRSISPYLSGRRNDNYVSKNVTGSEDVWTITNPIASKKNYNEIMTRIQKKEKSATEEIKSIEFFNPESAFNTNRQPHPYKNKKENNKINRSFITCDSGLNNDEEQKFNRSTIIQSSNKLDKDNNKLKNKNSTFDFNERCKLITENRIRDKIKRNQYFTENAALTLMLINKPKEYILPDEVIPLNTQPKNVDREKRELTSFDLNEKNKEYVNSKIKEKVEQRKNLIENISHNLILKQKGEKDYLTNRFQKFDNSFNRDNQDHVRERYEKNYTHNTSSNNPKLNTYYDQVKAFNSKNYEFNDEVSQVNLDNHFKQVKKVSEILHETKIVHNELDNTKSLTNRTVKKCTIPVSEYKRVKTRESDKKIWK